MQKQDMNENKRPLNNQTKEEESNMSELSPLSQFLLGANISMLGETYSNVINRVLNQISRIETKNYKLEENEVCDFLQSMRKAMEQGDFVAQSTVLQNLGRFQNHPLNACTVPKIAWNDDFEKIKSIITQYHEEGMGTGFNLSDTEDPITILKSLNDHFIDEIKNKHILRPVGNIALLSVNHEKILDFIELKNSNLNNYEWKFNFSVEIDDQFIINVLQDKKEEELTGAEKKSTKILDLIVKSAMKTGDPGIINLKKLNGRNPVPYLGEYKSVSPCGEVGLSEGETCQFGYINVGNFVDKGTINYIRLGQMISNAVRFLDDGLEYSIPLQTSSISEFIIMQKRKIGLGICGFADLLLQMDIEYGSENSLVLARDLMSFINYESKKASVQLSKSRGPFQGFHNTQNKYLQGYISKFYAQYETNTVRKEDWMQLEKDICEFGLRHCVTTALPPTGRSSLIVQATPQIEPVFSLRPGYKIGENPILYEKLANYYKNSGLKENEIINRIEKIKLTGKPEKGEILPSIFKTATEIAVESHLRMVAEFQKFTDETISKTVNLKEETTEEEVKNVFLRALELELIGITIYVDGSRTNQPMRI